MRKFIFGLVMVIAVSLSGWLTYGEVHSAKLEAQKYHAVFIEGNQVFFGHLKISSSNYILTDVYYLQNNTTQDPNAKLQLVKRGTEVHGPTDEMIFNKDKVLFTETLRDDGTVVKAIHDHEKK